MGWNDHFDPSEYDAADPDSMRALANRALMQGTTKNSVPADTDDTDKGDCWDCGRENVKLYMKGLCGHCYMLDNM